MLIIKTKRVINKLELQPGIVVVFEGVDAWAVHETCWKLLHGAGHPDREEVAALWLASHWRCEADVVCMNKHKSGL